MINISQHYYGKLGKVPLSKLEGSIFITLFFLFSIISGALYAPPRAVKIGIPVVFPRIFFLD